jgi:hypothetical protein
MARYGEHMCTETRWEGGGNRTHALSNFRPMPFPLHCAPRPM